MATKKSTKTERTRVYTKPFEAYAAKNGKYTTTMKYGGDKNKVKQSGNPVTRGENTYVARQCSAHIRTVYPPYILQDHDANDQNGEFCVNGRTDEYANNECKLCGIQSDEKWENQTLINIAEAVGGKEKMLYVFGSNYPQQNKYTILRIKKNGVVIIKYYIKLIPYSSLIKTSAPSGYKYKDRASLSKFIKLQSNAHKDVIFCLSGNEVHSVGFWNLLKDGGIRKMIQLQQEKSLDACFYLLFDRQSTDVETIDVELIINRHDMKNEPKSLWHWNRNTNNDNTVSPSLSLSPASTMSLPSNTNPNFIKNQMPFINNNEMPNINQNILNNNFNLQDNNNINSNLQSQQCYNNQQTQHMNSNQSPVNMFSPQYTNSDINDDDHSVENNDIDIIRNSPSDGGYSCDNSNNFKKKCRRKDKQRISTFQCTNSNKKYDNEKKDSYKNNKKLNRQNKINQKASLMRKCCNNNDFDMPQIINNDNSIMLNMTSNLGNSMYNEYRVDNSNDTSILTDAFNKDNQIMSLQKENYDLKNQIEALLAQQPTHNHNPYIRQPQQWNNGTSVNNNQQYYPHSQQGNPQNQQQFQQQPQPGPPPRIYNNNQMGMQQRGQSQHQNNNNPYNNQPQHHGHARSSNSYNNQMTQQIQQPAPNTNDIEELFPDVPIINDDNLSYNFAPFDPNQSTVNMPLNGSVDPFPIFNTTKWINNNQMGIIQQSQQQNNQQIQQPPKPPAPIINENLSYNQSTVNMVGSVDPFSTYNTTNSFI